jgi:hypothetical protein
MLPFFVYPTANPTYSIHKKSAPQPIITIPPETPRGLVQAVDINIRGMMTEKWCRVYE